MPDTKQLSAIARKFYRLAAVWKVTTVHVSDITEKCSHPAYEQIIALGPETLPFIFDELAREPDDWFVALRKLTGANPVPSQSRGKLADTTNAWLHWARENGYYTRHTDETGLSEPELANVRRE